MNSVKRVGRASALQAFLSMAGVAIVCALIGAAYSFQPTFALSESSVVSDGPQQGAEMVEIRNSLSELSETLAQERSSEELEAKHLAGLNEFVAKWHEAGAEKLQQLEQLSADTKALKKLLEGLATKSEVERLRILSEQGDVNRHQEALARIEPIRESVKKAEMELKKLTTEVNARPTKEQLEGIVQGLLKTLATPSVHSSGNVKPVEPECSPVQTIYCPPGQTIWRRR